MKKSPETFDPFVKPHAKASAKLPTVGDRDPAPVHEELEHAADHVEDDMALEELADYGGDNWRRDIRPEEVGGVDLRQYASLIS